MVVLSLSPALGWMGGFLAMIVGAIIGLLIREPSVPEPHDPEAEIRRLTRKVRHPWKARASRFLGVG